MTGDGNIQCADRFAAMVLSTQAPACIGRGTGRGRGFLWDGSRALGGFHRPSM
jgi:hypothetical protein